MTDSRQSTHNYTKSYTQPHPVPASDTLVLGAAKATSYGPRVEPYNDGFVESAKSDMDADFWSVYEWRTSRHALDGGWWEWLADCDTEDVARTLAEAIAHEAAAELRRLHAEVESLRTDAERYRWLRDKADSITVCAYTNDGEWIPLHPKNIDSTIDAAMKEVVLEVDLDKLTALSTAAKFGL